MHRSIIEKWLEIWSGGDLDELDAIVAPDFARYPPPSFDMATHGFDEIREAIVAYRTAFPDARITLGEILSRGEEAFYRWNQTGTNTGPGDFPPTGNSMDITGVCYTRFRDGRMIEEVAYFDSMEFMTQLGLMEAPAEE